VDGVVQQLAIHTDRRRGHRSPALMIIVPDGAQVTAEVTLDNKDIGFVNPRQDAAIKLETFLHALWHGERQGEAGDGRCGE
jgi:hemolysin D